MQTYWVLFFELITDPTRLSDPFAVQVRKTIAVDKIIWTFVTGYDKIAVQSANRVQYLSLYYIVIFITITSFDSLSTGILYICKDGTRIEPIPPS